MGENIEVKDVQKTEYLDKNGLDMLWAKVKENTHNQVEIERNRAVAKENSIVDTKADKSEFSNYVPSATFTALEKKVSANTAAISNKQNAGNYLHYETLNDEGYYEIPNVCISESDAKLKAILDPYAFQIVAGDLEGDGETGVVITSNDRNPYIALTDSANRNTLKITREGISNTDNNANHVYATDGSLADLTQYALSSTLAALEQKVTANTTAISAKQDAGNYIPYTTTDNETIGDSYVIDGKNGITNLMGSRSISFDSGCLFAYDFDGNNNPIEHISIDPHYGGSYSNAIEVAVDGQNPYTIFAVNWEDGLTIGDGDGNNTLYTGRGIYSDQYHDCLATSDASFKPISDFVLKTELPTVPTKTSELTNDSNFIIADDVDDAGYYLNNALNFGLKNNGVITIDSSGIISDVGGGFMLNNNGLRFGARDGNEIPTADGSFIDIDNYALKSQVTALEQTVTDNTTALEGKQDAGNYIPYVEVDSNNVLSSYYNIKKPIRYENGNERYAFFDKGQADMFAIADGKSYFNVGSNGIYLSNLGRILELDSRNISSKITNGKKLFYISDTKITLGDESATSFVAKIDANGIKFKDRKNTEVPVADGSGFADLNNYVLKSAYDEKIAALEARIAALEAKHPEAAE